MGNVLFLLGATLHVWASSFHGRLDFICSSNCGLDAESSNRGQLLKKLIMIRQGCYIAPYLHAWQVCPYLLGAYGPVY
eukprot:scaffold237980_cov16-Prasinocladus_malaysianus.AAC.1